MIQNIICIKKEYKKQGAKWQLVRESNKKIDENFYNNIIGAKKFFQNLGGYERHIENFTKWGRKVEHVISINPSRDYKSDYLFDFEKSQNIF